MVQYAKGYLFEPCKHCGKKTHASENCFSHYPEKLAEYRAAHGRGTSRATRGQGTTSTTRGSVSVAAACPISAAQSSWVLDSGASFHVTSDGSRLVACKPVNDDASIQTADGTSCHITHQGSLSSSNFSVPNVSLYLSYL